MAVSLAYISFLRLVESFGHRSPSLG